MSNNRSSIDDSPKEDGKNELLFRCLLHLALSLFLSALRTWLVQLFARNE